MTNNPETAVVDTQLPAEEQKAALLAELEELRKQEEGVKGFLTLYSEGKKKFPKVKDWAEEEEELTEEEAEEDVDWSDLDKEYAEIQSNLQKKICAISQLIAQISAEQSSL
ncbi:MAG: hypothetical protein LBR73_01210 [Oscillospiraceae bacterium]|jgi:hypothetical protein|nr:hypothetical protein [Oscillospiraceae bacterium]